MEFIGQKTIVAFFDNAIGKGKLAHAYCLAGLDSVGKRALAQKIAGKLLQTAPEKLAGHSDYILLGRETEEKTGKLKKNISVEQSRWLVNRLSGKSWQSGYRVCIIDEAETLNEASGNGLLKLLEEPGAQTVFFLLTVDAESILPTIRSRCQMIRLSPVAENEIKDGLTAAGYSADEAAIAAGMSWGRPGRAINYLRDETARQDYHSEIERWRSLKDEPFYKKIAISDDLFGDKIDHIRSRDRLGRAIDLWIMQWRHELRSGFSGETGKTCAILEDLQEAKHYLKQNIHPRLLLERILLKF